LAIRPSAIEAGYLYDNHKFLKNGRKIFFAGRLDSISENLPGRANHFAQAIEGPEIWRNAP
jgi:hypothetical protein